MATQSHLVKGGMLVVVANEEGKTDSVQVRRVGHINDSCPDVAVSLDTEGEIYIQIRSRIGANLYAVDHDA